MRRFVKGLIIITILCLFLVGSGGVSAVSVDGYDGYAAYRDGVAFGIEWHAAIMNRPSSEYSDAVIHANKGKPVKYGDWWSFVDDDKFIGIYKPKTGLTTLQRNYAVSTAKRLASENIAYDVTCQLNYSSERYGKWVRSSDITTMRCDGVVEYAYEWNEIRVYGDIENYLWNVAWGGEDTWKHHSYFNITPKKQAQEYMTLVRDSRPVGSYK